MLDEEIKKFKMATKMGKAILVGFVCMKVTKSNDQLPSFKYRLKLREKADFRVSKNCPLPTPPVPPPIISPLSPPPLPLHPLAIPKNRFSAQNAAAG